jgi:hypothetical protein
MSEQQTSPSSQSGLTDEQKALYWKIGGVVALCLLSGWIGFKYGVEVGAKAGFQYGTRAGERVMDEAWRSSINRN